MNNDITHFFKIIKKKAEIKDQLNFFLFLILFLFCFSLLWPYVSQASTKTEGTPIIQETKETKKFMAELPAHPYITDPSRLKKIQLQQKKSPTDMLPIVTPEMSVGSVSKHAIHGLTFPVFIIGSDPVSIAWVKQHRKVFKSLHAIGWLVNVHNFKELQEVKEVMQDLPLISASGQVFAKELGLTHYPLLMINDHVEQ